MKFSALALCAATACASAFTFTACGGTDYNLLQENIIDDNYDNYYQIFVRSYYDTDGDGIGDFNGVTEKLDYIRDMGYTGIWLMPIHPSPSYHGYDVTDYYAVNSDFGTMADYENLVTKAHEKGIKVIIDLVVNHSSDQHPWFKEGAAFRNGQGGSSKYSSYYNWSSTEQPKYSKIGNVYYESQFDKSMPDFNIEGTALREEVGNIIKFWIDDKKTDGFRLDGCYYYSSEGVNSFFDFEVTGEVVKAVNNNSSTSIWNSINKNFDSADGNIAAPFLSNHDNGKGRVAGQVGREADKIKFAYGLLSMFSGNTFTYYGDEIGMTAVNPQSDPDLRIGMLWDDIENVTTPPFGASEKSEYLFGSVKSQQKDESSILSYYKLCNNARNAFPALMRGVPEKIDYDDREVLIMKKTYQGQSVTVVINTGLGDKKVKGVEGALAQSICVDGNISKKGSALNMPARSIAILT